MLYETQVALQGIASLALTVTFIYAAMQFRDWKRAQHVTNFAKLVEMQMHLREMRIQDPTLAHVYQQDVANLGSEQAIREHFFNMMQLSIFEIAWFSHREGQLSDDYFDSLKERIRALAIEPSFQRALADPAVKIMHEGFLQFLRDLLRAGDAMPAN